MFSGLGRGSYSAAAIYSSSQSDVKDVQTDHSRGTETGPTGVTGAVSRRPLLSLSREARAHPGHSSCATAATATKALDRERRRAEAHKRRGARGRSHVLTSALRRSVINSTHVSGGSFEIREAEAPASHRSRGRDAAAALQSGYARTAGTPGSLRARRFKVSIKAAAASGAPVTDGPAIPALLGGSGRPARHSAGTWLCRAQSWLRAELGSAIRGHSHPTMERGEAGPES
ncbi:hypothetical protein AAFF_G00174980 [Aldrovandia affinis]|uniref:Uncharacterized protein n=1 Tax=Aldrovandia affinis TaxID=143900 RepID=A0AAD7RLT7_9TELE|nr:hypothetical protein AAFF_G00174980 [Aldrovandia affinis]